MGRKKNSFIENSDTTNKDSLSYSGTIYIKVLKGKQVCSSRVFKNKGRWPLFRFFSLCLKGDYAGAGAFQPRYINLFNVNAETIPNISDESGLNLTSYLTNQTRITITDYPYNSSPIVSEAPNEDDQNPLPIGSSSIRYKFLIPFTQLNFDQSQEASENTRVVNALALYCNEFFDRFSQPSAFFFVRKESDPTNPNYNKFGNLLEGFTDFSNLNEYNLSIEWELVISN